MKLMKISINTFIKRNFLLLISLTVIFCSYFFCFSQINKTVNELDALSNVVTLNQSYFFFKKSTPFEIYLLHDLKNKMISERQSFIEVNLQEMTTRLYQNGDLNQEFKIIAKGNPLNWGGSPTGIYRVMDKHVTAYSNSTMVYMPFAIQYYGKYFIHGIPYYPGGNRIFSTYSGGCIRHSDMDAQKIFQFSEIDMPLLVIDKKRNPLDVSFIEENKELDILAESFMIADIDSGVVLAEKNYLQRKPIASITKLMTAIVALENIGLNRSVSINQEMINNGYGYSPGFEEGKRYQLIELLYPLLTRSSNQAAEALTGFMGRDKTIQLMNEKAQLILMTNTKFTDPSGIENTNISTTRDLFYLARYIHNNFPLLLSITKGDRVPMIQYLRFDLDEIGNKNIFIYDPTFIGGKTGFTNASKQTGLFVFSLFYEQQKRDIAIIFLRSTNVKRDAQTAYGWLLQNGFTKE